MLTCSIEGCTRPVKMKALQMCQAHYLRKLRHGDPLLGGPMRNLNYPKDSICVVTGCQNRIANREHGMCNPHYLRRQRYGDPLGGGPMLPFGRTLAERLESKIDRAGDCWIWTGASDGTGYGQINVDGIHRRAVHIVMYEMHVGPVPDGLELDHLCHNRDMACSGGSSCVHRRCCNPAHLEPVTRRENALRGVKGRPDVRTHCSKGHALDSVNVYIDPNGGYRKCRICRAAKVKAFWDRKKRAKSNA